MEKLEELNYHVDFGPYYVHLTRKQKKYLAVRSVIDRILAVLALVLLSPLFLAVSIAQKVSAPDEPIFFLQKRVGKGAHCFNIIKFRTMKSSAPKNVATGDLENPQMYISKVGRFLRDTSIDELPQLFNILIGDMSLVGPRPERPQYVEKFKEEIPRYMIKHQVRPGLTGWAQINGYRGDTSIRKRIEYDIYYIENWSMSFDFKIMFLTIFRGFINENAY